MLSYIFLSVTALRYLNCEISHYFSGSPIRPRSLTCLLKQILYNKCKYVSQHVLVLFQLVKRVQVITSFLPIFHVHTPLCIAVFMYIYIYTY